MFTGIIEDVGTIREVRKAGGVSILVLETGMELTDTIIGDSISVSGVCLTVVEVGKNSFSVEATPETLSRSTLSANLRGLKVNLEKALKVGGRMGGHMVQGHIDGVGKINEVKREMDSLIIEITPPEFLIRYMVDKGSIAVDGISLTVNSIDDNVFTINIIRHSAQNTTLNDRKVGDTVNLEADIISKYVEKFLSRKDVKEEGLTLKKLSEEGFI